MSFYYSFKPEIGRYASGAEIFQHHLYYRNTKPANFNVVSDVVSPTYRRTVLTNLTEYFGEPDFLFKYFVDNSKPYVVNPNAKFQVLETLPFILCFKTKDDAFLAKMLITS